MAHRQFSDRQWQGRGRLQFEVSRCPSCASRIRATGRDGTARRAVIINDRATWRRTAGASHAHPQITDVGRKCSGADMGEAGHDPAVRSILFRRNGKRRAGAGRRRSGTGD